MVNLCSLTALFQLFNKKFYLNPYAPSCRYRTFPFAWYFDGVGVGVHIDKQEYFISLGGLPEGAAHNGRIAHAGDVDYGIVALGDELFEEGAAVDYVVLLFTEGGEGVKEFGFRFCFRSHDPFRFYPTELRSPK